MLSHFVNKDTKNWDKYVTFAVMAYRATPHCTVKYSPYYLVFGRDLRLPIEDDWKPRIHTEANSEVDYENHVRQLAERLREAYKVAGQQSKQSHKIAKRYYDQKSTQILYKKGELVYLYNPIAKRGKAKKVSYHYQGPYEILAKSSPLRYQVKIGEDRTLVVHVNRLKKVHKPYQSIGARK
jgi:hypothetical protein